MNKEQNHALVVVPFGEDVLWAVDNNGQPFVPAKKIADNIGLHWSTQNEKLKAAQDRFRCAVIRTTASDGKNYEMLCLPARKIPAWLMTISPDKVKPEIRGKLVRYQNECDDVIWDYWSKGHAVNPRVREAKAPADTTTAVPTDEYISLLKDRIRLLSMVPPKRTRRDLTPAEMADIQAMKKEGYTHREIAKRLNRPHGTIRLALDKIKKAVH